jgi:hypothetical protein
MRRGRDQPLQYETSWRLVSGSDLRPDVARVTTDTLSGVRSADGHIEASNPSVCLARLVGGRTEST